MKIDWNCRTEWMKATALFSNTIIRKLYIKGLKKIGWKYLILIVWIFKIVGEFVGYKNLSGQEFHFRGSPSASTKGSVNIWIAAWEDMAIRTLHALIKFFIKTRIKISHSEDPTLAILCGCLYLLAYYL